MNLMMKLKLLPPHSPTDCDDWEEKRGSIETEVPELLKGLEKSPEMLGVYDRYSSSKPDYIDLRKYYGRIETFDQLFALLEYADRVKREAGLGSGAVVYPSCQQDEENKQLVSFITPQKDGKSWAHFEIKKETLIINGLLYYNDIASLCEDHSLSAPGYYSNEREERFPESFEDSISGIPHFLKGLDQNEAVAAKYENQRENYPFLRHLGIIPDEITLRHLFMHLVEEADEVGETDKNYLSSAYTYPSSADASCLSLNFESPGEDAVFLNVSVPIALFETARKLNDFAFEQYRLILGRGGR